MGVAGLNGEFFDCDEVETYLHERGVDIPPGSEYVTVEIDEAAFCDVPPLSSLPPLSSSRSSISSSSDSPRIGGPLDPGLSFGLTQHRNTSNPSNIFTSGDTLLSLPSLVDPEAWNLPSSDPRTSPRLNFSQSESSTSGRNGSTSPKKKRVTIDVNLLVMGKFPSASKSNVA